MSFSNRTSRSTTLAISLAILSCIGWSASALSAQWPVHLNAKGYLEDAAGVPFVVMGDAGWAISTQLNPAEVIEYLDNRKQKGFTAAIVGATDRYPPLGPENYAGEVPFPKGLTDWSERNEAYWTHIDFIVQQAKDRGMLIFLAPAYVGYQCTDEGWCAEMQAQTNAAMTDYGTWVGNRYKSYGNIVWVEGGDVDCGDYPPVCDRVNAIANAIRAADPTALQTAHSGRQRSALDDYAQPWLNINSTYSECTNYATRLRTDYQRSNALPFVFIEGRYENDTTPVTVGCYQGQAISSYLGGALLGHVFGNGKVFNKSPGWDTTQGMDSAGSIAMGNIAKLMSSRKWYDFAPDYNNATMTSSKSSGENYQATARTSTGETVMVWFPQVTTATVVMSRVSGTQAHGWWWNPVNNTATSIGTFDTTGNKTFTPTQARMVLVLDNAAANLPTPGQTSPTLRPKAPTGLQAN